MRSFLSYIFIACGLALGMIGGAGAEPIKLIDQLDRVISLEQPAERLVVIPIPSASTVISLDGATDRLVGMHPLAKAAIEEAILGEFFPQAKAIASDILGDGGSEGFAPNVEAIAMLNPDLVIQWGDRQDDVVGPLTNAGLNVALILYGDEDKARATIKMLGLAIGKADKQDEIIDWRDNTIAGLEKALAGLVYKEKPTVLYLLRTQSELRVAGSNTYYDFQFKLAGGINAAAEIEGFKTVNPEQIAEWNPDVILLNNFEAGLTLSRVYDDPILSLTKAAQAKRVYKLPLGGYRWDPPSQESPLAWKWMAKIFHPNVIYLNLRHEIETWYPKLYGHTPTPEQIDAILRLEMNGDSAHYDSFKQ